MSKNNITIEEFQNNLFESLSWRRKELNLIKNKMIPNSYGTPLNEMLRRAGVLLLYAHWEGYIKEAFTFYLQHVSFQRKKYSELKPQFIALCLKSKINNMETNKFETQTKSIEFLIDKFESRSNIPHKKIINTKANLSFNVFNDLLFVIGVEQKKYLNKKDIINELLESRNHIAHGKMHSMNDTVFLTFFDEFDNLMNSLNTDLINIAAMKEYQKNS